MDIRESRVVSLEYIAGFIDGEGHVSVVRRKRKGRNNYSYAPILMITNTDKRVLEIIKERLGGSSCLSRTINISSYSKRPYLYRISIAKLSTLKSVLEEIIPYLIIKKEQAILVYDFVCSRLKRIESFDRSTGIGTAPPYHDSEVNIYSMIEERMPRGHLN